MAITIDRVRALDSATDSVTVTATNLDIRDLSASQDNVAISDGTDTLAIAADGSIAVTDNGTTLSVDDGGSTLSIDDGGGSITVDGTVAIGAQAFVYAEDSAFTEADDGAAILSVRQDTLATSTSADGDYQSIKSNASGEIYTTDEGAEALLTTIDADTSALAAALYAEDSAHVSGDSGNFMLAVRSDTKASTAGTDGDYAALIQDADGDLYVSDTVAQGSLSTIAGAVSGTEMQVDIVSASGQYAEDAAHTTGDLGNFMLAVANHTEGALHSADGDYAALQVDAQGRLRIIGDLDLTGDLVGDDEADTEDPLKVGSRTYDQGSALAAVSAAGDKANLASDLYRRIHINEAFNVGWQVAAATVTTTAAEIAASPLAGRKTITVQNNGSADVALGTSGAVTFASGLIVPKKSSATYEWGEALNVFAIAESGSQDVRVAEFA